MKIAEVPLLDGKNLILIELHSELFQIMYDGEYNINCDCYKGYVIRTCSNRVRAIEHFVNEAFKKIVKAGDFDDS